MKYETRTLFHPVASTLPFATAHPVTGVHLVAGIHPVVGVHTVTGVHTVASVHPVAGTHSFMILACDRCCQGVPTVDGVCGVDGAHCPCC
jgi:hypothetical protein